MFEKNVAGMVKSLRENSESSEYVSVCLSEIRSELGSSNANVKVNAFLKLGYLSMLGVDMQAAQMPVIEILSTSNFLLKRPAMFVASIAFRDFPEILLLTTNIFLKEFRSSNYIEVACAVACMASVCSGDIANQVVNPVVTLGSHSQPLVRKKAALALFRICEKSPNLFLTNVFPKLKDLLADPDQSVQAAAVNTFVEIAKRNAKLAIPAIPLFFHLLTDIKCNWILIKLLKLMEYICAVESRMWTKLVSSRALLGLNLKAKSVQIEFCRFVLKQNAVHGECEIMQKAIYFLKDFLSSPDANIKCIALNITSDFLSRNPDFKEVAIVSSVLKAVDSSDCTLRIAALNALKHSIDTPESATHAIQQLLALYAKFEDLKNIRVDIVDAILAIGARQDLVPDTEWYLRILVLLSDEASERIINQFKDYARSRDSEIVVKIALAALNRPSITDSLSAACAWSLGFHVKKNHLSTPDTLTAVVKLLLHKTYLDDRTGIDCVWGAVKIAVAVFLNTGEKQILAILKANIEEIQSRSFSVGLSQVFAVALDLIHWVSLQGTENREEIESLIFRVADDQNSPFPELEDIPDIKEPATLMWDQDEGSTDAYYTDTEEDDPCVSKSSHDIFSVESVLIK